ncbi:MAG: hypothetical protein JWR22_2301 [Herminiimonas sp.]|nr:hypothetical protein [Herminiimonas sp.]
MKLHAIASLACIATALAGCGGATTQSINSAEGFWAGTVVSNGNPAVLAVLEDGQAFGLASNAAGVTEGFYGSIVGNGTGLRGGSGRDLLPAAQTVTNITWSGSVANKSTITATTSSGATIAANYNAAYDQTSNIANVAGNYSGVGFTGNAGGSQSVAVAIDSNGALALTAPLCTGTATVIGRGNGKNIFNVRIGFSGASCPLFDGGTTVGVVFVDQSVAPKRLYIMTMANDASDGFFWTGV